MESPSRQSRPRTAGGLARQRREQSHDHDDDDGTEDQEIHRRCPPVRPSTQRATSSTPRAAAVDAARRTPDNSPDEFQRLRLEVESLRTKLREADFAKAQAQARHTYPQIIARMSTAPTALAASTSPAPLDQLNVVGQGA